MRQQVLVIQPLPGIGDTLWFLPHLKALENHYEEKADLFLHAKPTSRADQVLEATISLKKILWLKREEEHGGLWGFWRLIDDLKKHHFDAVWVLHKSPRYALAAWAAGIPNIYSYGLSYGKWISTPPFLKEDDLPLHPIERAKALLKHHGINIDSMDKVPLEVLPNLQDLMRKRYNLKKLRKTPVVLGIGGSEIYKKWPTHFFAELALELYQKGYEIFVLGGLQEKKEVLLIQSLIQEKGGNITPVFDLSLQEAFAFLSCMKLFVGNDTSMLNAAALLGVETFGIFAKTFPLEYRSNLHPITSLSQTGDVTIGDITVDQVLGRILERI